MFKAFAWGLIATSSLTIGGWIGASVAISERWLGVIMGTPRGATIQAVLASVLQTCHQQRVDPFPLLADLLRAPAPRVAPLPALLAGH